MNCTQEEQTVRCYGAWISFKPGQIKSVQDHMGHFICVKKKENGLVELPEAFEDMAYRDTPEGKEEMERRREQGINAYVEFHQRVIHNNQVSLRRDLERANIKADPLVFASKGELSSIELVAKYQKSKDDKIQKQVERAKELLKTIKST